MASRALTTWRKERRERLDELLHAHQSVGGPSRGRRWRTATLNEALLLRLAAEFQGFARDLHEQTCDTFAAWITPSDPTVQQVMRKPLVLGTYRRWRRDLDGLTASLDGEIAAQLGRLFQRQSPW